VSNLSIALSLIMAVETPSMNCHTIGDKHLPVAHRSHGRMQIRSTVIDDLIKWDRGQVTWSTSDSRNPELDALIAQRWLLHYCGSKATVKRYCQVWNGGPVGWRSADAKAYYQRAMRILVTRPEYYDRCKAEIRRMGI